MSAIVLRDYQRRALDELARVRRAGARRVLLVSSTGSGKGTVSAYILAGTHAKGNRGLFVVHRGEILEDLYARVRAAGATSVGLLRGGERARRDPGARIQIASVDSLRGRTPPPADVVIVDEAHRASSRGHASLLAHYPDTLVLGLTGTPVRLDRTPLSDTFDAMVTMAQPSELVAGGWIVAPRVFTVPEAELPDLSGVGTRGGDFAADELAAAVQRTELIGSIVEHWGRRARGLRTICCAVNLAHSRAIVARLEGAGIRARHVDGASGAAARQAALADLRAHRLDVVSQCNVWVEGVDAPEAKCMVLARPTQSLTIYLQAVGRIVRPWEDVEAVVLDHAGNARRHGLPHEDRDWEAAFAGAPRRSRREGGALEPEVRARTCPACFAVFETTAAACPVCGKPVERKVREVEERPGELVELEAAGARRAFWERAWRDAYARGYEPGYAAARHRERYGEPPPADWAPPPRPATPATPEDKVGFLRTLGLLAHRQGKGYGWIERRYFNRFGELPAKPGPAATPAAPDVVEGEF